MLQHLLEFIQNKTARAIGIVFACCGLVFGSWASFIPYVKEKFQLDEAELGLLLLSMPAGILTFNPVAVIAIRKYGSVVISCVAVVLMAVTFALPIVVPSIPLVVIGLLLGGAMFSITNVAMNTCASTLEETQQIRIMASSHGMWSIGAMAGALLSGLSLNFLNQCCADFVTPHRLYVMLQILLVMVIIMLIFPQLNMLPVTAPQPETERKNGWRSFKPTKELWVIISICLCSYLTEGTIADWSAVYLREVIHASESIAGRGFAVYAFFMAAGRFLGDGLISKFGSMPVLRGGGVLAILGLLTIIFAPTHFLAMPGFMLTGAGISIASPILYQASARVKGLAPGVGLATMNTFAMAAFLGGPVLIGFVAQTFNLRIAFGAVAFVALIWVLQTNRIIRKASTDRIKG